MAEIALPVVVTAIANPEVEGFIAGTLFSQGWNVIFRALDSTALVEFLDSDPDQCGNVVLIYSPDLPGMSPDVAFSLQGRVRQILGFSANSNLNKEYTGLMHLPGEASELLNLVRGSVRTPLTRNPGGEFSGKRRTHVVAVGSASGSAGCTTLAINLAMELSALGRETMLVDADVRHPSIAPLLSLHKLDSETSSRTLAPHLKVSEFTQERVPHLAEYLDGLFAKSEFAVIDLGSIAGVSDSLTDRRWTSSMVHWSCERANALWIVGKCDALGLHRMERLVHDFSQITMRAQISVALNMSPRGRKGKLREEQYFAAVAPLRPQNLFTLPRDIRTVSKAEEERATLLEIDDRSSLRKSIASMAFGLSS
ncbi:MAG TPA: P-loop NTPase [Candidatus Nanopelagicaceae bacterium]|jgi:hypothetical protein